MSGVRRAVVVAVVLAAAAACRRPAEGDACRDLGRASCVDGAHVLACRQYAWHLDACRGPDGCRSAGDAASCDTTLADEGDACGERSKTSCTRDRSALLACDGVRFARVATCGGPDACTPGPHGASCDARIAREGDPCVAPAPDRQRRSATACTPEHDAKLVCLGGLWVLRERCRGPSACSLERDGATCDASVAEPGDPCNWMWLPCGADGILGQSFAEMRSARKTRCKLMITPDSRDEYGYACSPDRTKLLHCGGQTPNAVQSMSVVAQCPHTCNVTESSWECT